MKKGMKSQEGGPPNEPPVFLLQRSPPKILCKKLIVYHHDWSLSFSGLSSFQTRSNFKFGVFSYIVMSIRKEAHPYMIPACRQGGVIPILQAVRWKGLCSLLSMESFASELIPVLDNEHTLCKASSGCKGHKVSLRVIGLKEMIF